MKELSIEEKAIVYDEVVGKLKRFMAQGVDPLITRADVQDFFPEINESEDDRIKKALICGMNALKKQGKETFASIPIDDCIVWLEKQGSQKPVDKAELKFKVGDWIVFNGLTLRINEVVQGYYRTISIGDIRNSYDWDIDNIARLWTIADAKDGDVLCCDNGNTKTIYLFKEQRGSSNIANTYFQILNMNNELRLMFNKAADFNLNTKPATKEQRDLLFLNMREAGYEWNEEKKELKKNEN